MYALVDMHPLYDTHGTVLGMIYCDFLHDSDPVAEFYGRCVCGWSDLTDHTVLLVAEASLLAHAAAHTGEAALCSPC